MLDSRKVAITGGVASGKTTASRLFRELGARVVSADALVHELLDPRTDLGQRVIHLLGADVLRNGRFDRALIADKVFRDPQLLRSLEQLLHPAVLQRIEEEYEIFSRREGTGLFIAEVPLLFEIGAERFFDAVIAVECLESIARERYVASGKSKEEYDRRMNRQLSPQIKQGKARYTIHNNGTLEDLRKQVAKIYTELTHQS